MKQHATPPPVKQRNYTPLIIVLTIVMYAVIAALSFLPKIEGETSFDLTLLPLLNAIFNSFTFLFLLSALIMIKRKNIVAHRRFIYAAFATTFFFLISYVTYHALAESTAYGGSGLLAGIYYFVLVSHIVLAAVIVPLALFTVARGLNMQVARHRKIARWTMPLWLYVSLTGVLVYIMIAPYY
ncbi:DUF420 domain-containing protein [Numidum massiliense]|uniref:DUF420 domain-containing protein n=1 Tax=Numidum massiliense TaxID=1522315 RepID=UPI0006D5B783|nr:DUF420 domain-containing protein [Numidum massiliense]